MYKVIFKGNRGSLLIDHYIESKNGKAIRVFIGECTCYKNTCDCVHEMVLHNRLVERVEKLTYLD